MNTKILVVFSLLCVLQIANFVEAQNAGAGAQGGAEAGAGVQGGFNTPVGGANAGMGGKAGAGAGAGGQGGGPRNKRNIINAYKNAAQRGDGPPPGGKPPRGPPPSGQDQGSPQ